MNVHETIARRVRELRDAKGWSLDALAERSQVSRSNISLIERGQSSPTAIVLDKLSMAFGVSLAALFEQSENVTIPAPSPHCSRHEQLVWKDPESGYVRRNVSPPAWSPIQLVEVQFPPGKRVAYETGLRDADIHQQVWMMEGVMEITVGDRGWRLETGDCLTMKLDRPIVFRNTWNKTARYLVALSKPSSDEARSK